MKTRQKKAGVLGRMVRAVSAVFPENYMLQTSQYEVCSPKLPAAFDGFRIVQLSDLHGRASAWSRRRLLAAVRSAQPDAVVFTGDAADRHTRDYNDIFRLLEALCGSYPVYFSTGNHEQDLACRNRKPFFDGMRALGVRVLDNSSETLERGGESITLSGVRVPLRYYRWNTRAKQRPVLAAADMTRLLGTPGPGYTVLLAHNPLCFEAYAAWGADLTLSGHVHGGMFRLPGGRGLLSPERTFFPRYSGGVYRMGKVCLLVSRGLAFGPRLNNRPEIVALTLRCAPEDRSGRT